MVARAAALALLALCARAQLVTLCPAAQGSAAAWAGAVQGLTNPETYVVLLHLLPDGVTAWGAAARRRGAARAPNTRHDTHQTRAPLSPSQTRRAAT
jgi:hypothetical protein